CWRPGAAPDREVAQTLFHRGINVHRGDGRQAPILTTPANYAHIGQGRHSLVGDALESDVVVQRVGQLLTDTEEKSLGCFPLAEAAPALTNPRRIADYHGRPPKTTHVQPAGTRSAASPARTSPGPTGRCAPRSGGYRSRGYGVEVSAGKAPPMCVPDGTAHGPRDRTQSACKTFRKKGFEQVRAEVNVYASRCGLPTRRRGSRYRRPTVRGPCCAIPQKRWCGGGRRGPAGRSVGGGGQSAASRAAATNRSLALG